MQIALLLSSKYFEFISCVIHDGITFAPSNIYKCNTISLITSMNKILMRILQRKVTCLNKTEIGDDQGRFVEGKCTKNATELIREMAVWFIEYTKALDKVRHEDIFRMLKSSWKRSENS